MATQVIIQGIQVKTGVEANLPSEALLGQPLFTTDTKQLYMGLGVGVTPVVVGGGGGGLDPENIGTEGGVDDANKIPQLNSQGQLPLAMIPAGIGGGGSATIVIQSLGAVSGSVTPDLSLGKSINLTLTGMTTLSLANLPSTLLDKVYLFVSQDAVGSKSLVWGGSNIKWPGGYIPDISVTGNALDYFEFTWTGTAYILSNYIQDCK